MTQINCQTPKDRWEDLYCWGDLGLSAAAAVAEAARTRFFWEWKAIRHPALVPVPPPWGTTIPIPEGWTPANAVTRADPFYPQAFSRFAVKYFVQSAGVAAGLLNAVKTGDRLVSGDSEEEGTLVRDGLFFGASLTGLFAFSSPSRLERYDWGRFSASLSTAAMTVYAASDFKKLSQAPLNSPEWKMVATQASLAGLNYVAGRGLQPGQGKKLSKDRVTWRRMRREVNEGRYGVDDVVKVGETSPPEIWVRNEFGSFGMKRMPPNGTIEVRNTLFNIYDRVNGEVVKVGFMEMHWPYRGGERFGPPEVTIQIGEQFRDNGILARARYTAMQKYPDYFPPTWQTQTSWPGFTPTEAYDRTLLGTGTRVSASVSVFRQKQNVPDGETYFYNRPVKTIRPDHRW
ncbi:MAG: hypothetical protein Q7S98_02085, partial [Deltaproteobacteria bacterium]|nr:hypothetical protein [Deltaproteobacteria bacterium]